MSELAPESNVPPNNESSLRLSVPPHGQRLVTGVAWTSSAVRIQLSIQVTFPEEASFRKGDMMDIFVTMDPIRCLAHHSRPPNANRHAVVPDWTLVFGVLPALDHGHLLRRTLEGLAS